MKSKGEKVICVNKKARHDLNIEETYEAGLSLVGTEVKSLREGRAHLTDSYAKFKRGELYLVQAHISPYTHSSYENHDPLRARKLLLHKQEIRKLTGKITERGMTLVPLKMYFKNGRAKVELGLGRGKKEHDKRATIKQRDIDREMGRTFKGARIKY